MPENSSVLLFTISCERTQKLFLYLVTQPQQLCSAAVWKATATISRRQHLLKPASNWLMPFDSWGLLSDMKMWEKIMYYSNSIKHYTSNSTDCIIESYCLAISISVCCFFIDSFPFSLSFIQDKELKRPLLQRSNWHLEKEKRETTLKQIVGVWDWESDRLEKLNPRSNRQIGRLLLCSSAGRTNAVNITSVSGFCPIGANDTETCTQGFCYEKLI